LGGLQRGIEKSGFFLNLLGWERKPRVWSGQAVPQRRIFTPLTAVFWWRRHQIFMLAFARLI
jgi:hypothetical protein